MKVISVKFKESGRAYYFDPKELNTLRQYHSILQGHPDMNKTPGVDMTAAIGRASASSSPVSTTLSARNSVVVLPM